jgi:hypothetical protein
MKTILNIIALAVLLLVAPSPCFALWDVLDVSKDEAKKLGLEVRVQAADPNHVSVALEFKTEGSFKVFSPESKFKDQSSVQFWIGQADNPQVSAALREDRSKAGRVLVGFRVDRVHLDQSNLGVMVPYSDGALGGAQYRLRIKDFVELKK